MALQLVVPFLLGFHVHRCPTTADSVGSAVAAAAAGCSVAVEDSAAADSVVVAAVGAAAAGSVFAYFLTFLLGHRQLGIRV